MRSSPDSAWESHLLWTRRESQTVNTLGAGIIPYTQSGFGECDLYSCRWLEDVLSVVLLAGVTHDQKKSIGQRPCDPMLILEGITPCVSIPRLPNGMRVNSHYISIGNGVRCTQNSAWWSLVDVYGPLVQRGMMHDEKKFGPRCEMRMVVGCVVHRRRKGVYDTTVQC
jgi:hypothetical protein